MGIAIIAPLREEHRKLAEANQQLQARLHLLEDALETVRHAICVFDGEGRIVFRNQRYAEAIGLPPDKVVPGLSAKELIQMAWDAGYYPSDKTLAEIEVEFWRNLDIDRPTRAQIKRSGRTLVIHPGRTSDGNLVATFEDVTAQLAAEDALRQSEARLSAMLDATPDCVMIFDKDAGLTYINPAGLSLLEAPDFDALVSSGYVPIAPENQSAWADVHERVLAGETVVWTYEIIGMSGTKRSVEAHVVPFLFPDGERPQMSITRDITQRKAAEDALRRSEEKLRLIQEASGLADFENDGTDVTHCSDLFLEQVGLPLGDGTISIWDWLNIVHPDDRERLQAEMEQALVDAEEFDSEYRIIRQDTGEVRWVSCRTKLFRDDDNRVTRTIGAHRDITHRKNSEIALQESEQRLRLVQDITGLAEFWAGRDGITHVSERLADLLGLPPGTKELTMEDVLKTVHPDDREKMREDVNASLESSDTAQCEFRIIHARTGQVRWIDSRTRVQRDDSGRIVRSIGAHLDITEGKDVERVLRESEERFRLAAEAAGIGVWDYDPATGARKWSSRLLAIMGLPADTKPTRELAVESVHPLDRERFTALLDATLKDTSSKKFEETVRIVRADDLDERWVTINCWRTRQTVTSGDRIILTIRDVSEQKSAEERIRWAAGHDALTRLANRVQFQEKLEAAVKESDRIGRSIGLLLLDLDHFKQVNDTLGHDAGDELLKIFADRLRSVVRPGDTVARLGGDEFAIILSDVQDPHRLAELSASIQQRLREPFLHKGRILDCHASIGGASYPKDGESPEELMKNADMALYTAKNAGRCTSRIYEPKLRKEVELRTSMIQHARDAIRDDRVTPHYQPKVDLLSRKVIGFEALLRWQTPDGQVQLPDKLEAAFEDIHVAASLTDSMIKQAIVDMRRWLDEGLDFGHIAINTSAADFRRERFAEGVLEQLALAGIPTSMLQIEVTETVFLGRGAEYVHAALSLFSSQGVKIALDDFGTGYASLRHLREFPVDFIKIDRSFVRDMQHDAGGDAIVQAVIHLGQSLGMTVIAEGIERECHVEQLLSHGCMYGQGFLFARAQPAVEVPQLLLGAKKVRSKEDRASNIRLVQDNRAAG